MCGKLCKPVRTDVHGRVPHNRCHIAITGMLLSIPKFSESVQENTVYWAIVSV